MTNKINFITGATYTLSEIFSGERRIIIPDLQRDYCWGDPVHTEEKKELVTDFVASLMSQYQERKHGKRMNLGLIYGYESPADHIQLCDGQQRLTTLFLLIGMLNKLKFPGNDLRQLLISDREYFNDDQEPYLNYAIRETSLYFLRDLVCHFFVHEENDGDYVENVCDIFDEKSGQMCSWFFGEYIYDPSIRSMLRALGAIESAIKRSEISDWEDFSEFLVDRLTFMYYDMGNRSNGEETFVVINTTGEPLSTNQNLKPLVISAKINASEQNIAERWERIENWFWKNRDRAKNDTADAGFNEFLRWVTLIKHFSDTSNPNSTSPHVNGDILAERNLKFPIETISMTEIEDYFKAVQYIFTSEPLGKYFDKNEHYLSPGEPLSKIECFKLLPIIEYVRKYKITDRNDRNLIRVCEFINNLTRIDNVGKSVSSLMSEIIKAATIGRDPAEMLSHDISGSILTAEERRKFEIFIEASEARNKTEDSVWHAQEHKIWSGEIMPLINWSQSENKFNLNTFNDYSDYFERVFIGECDSNIDLTRRALLTQNLVDFPIGGTSFGWEWRDWKMLINKNQQAFKSFFDLLINSSDIAEAQQKLIDNSDSNSQWITFALNPFLLEYCNKKHIKYDDAEGLMLCESRWSRPFSVMNAMLLYSVGASWENEHNGKTVGGLCGWLMGWRKGSPGYLVLENHSAGLTADIRYNSRAAAYTGELYRYDKSPIAIGNHPSLLPDVPSARGGVFFTFRDKNELIGFISSLSFN